MNIHQQVLNNMKRDSEVKVKQLSKAPPESIFESKHQHLYDDTELNQVKNRRVLNMAEY